MTIQAKFNKQALDYFPEIKNIIKNANEFCANQIKCAVIKIASESHTALDKQTEAQIKDTESYMLKLFTAKNWI